MKYQLNNYTVSELINGNWKTIANFYNQTGSDNDARKMANALYQSLITSTQTEKEMDNISFDDNADKTDDIEDCDNKGCGFNVDGKCTASATECFGYIDPE